MEMIHFLNASSGTPKQRFVNGKLKSPKEFKTLVIQTHSETVKFEN